MLLYRTVYVLYTLANCIVYRMHKGMLVITAFACQVFSFCVGMKWLVCYLDDV